MKKGKVRIGCGLFALYFKTIQSILFLFLSHFALGQSLDSLQKRILQSPNDSIRVIEQIRLLEHLSNYDPATALHLCREWQEYYKQEKEIKPVLRLQAEQAKILLQTDEFYEGINLAYSLFLKSESLGDYSLSNLASIILSKYFVEAGNYTSAIEYLKKAHQYAMKAKDTLAIAESLTELAKVYSLQNNIKTAELAFAGALQYAKNKNNHELEAKILIEFAQFYLNIRNLEKAGKIIDSALVLVEKNLSSKIRPYVFLVHAKYYFQKGDDENCVKYIKWSCENFEKNSDIAGLSDCHLLLGKYYLFIKQLNKAKEAYLLALKYATSINDQSKKIKILKNLAEIHYLQGDFKKAYDYLNDYNVLLQKIRKIENVKRALELQFQQEILRKDREYKQLKAFTHQHQKMLEQQNKYLKSQKVIQWLLLVLLFLFAILIVVLWSVNRSRHKINQQILAKNREIVRQKEKAEWLFKELHHRVKNNFQLILSIIRLKLSKLDNDEAKKELEEIASKIHALAFIHERLYQTGEKLTLSTKEYIIDLCNQLLQFHNQKGKKIQCIFDIEENIELPVSTTIAIGLIINEAITNAVKYAFENTLQPEISISLKKKDKNLELTIKDNGKGFDTGAIRKESLGLELIHTLTFQLEGELWIDGSIGTTLRILIPLNE